jgi:hypothetical protein
MFKIVMLPMHLLMQILFLNQVINSVSNMSGQVFLRVVGQGWITWGAVGYVASLRMLWIFTACSAGVLDFLGKDTTLPQLLEKAGIHYKACTNTHNPTTPTSPNT